jgi:hypothetical protein
VIALLGAVGGVLAGVGAVVLARAWWRIHQTLREIDVITGGKWRGPGARR